MALLCVPVVVGALVMWLGGAPLARWAGHLGAGAVGLCVYAAVTRARPVSRKARVIAAFAAPLVVAATFGAPGLQGVHRWLVIAGVRLHASQLVMPGLLVFMATQLRRWPALVSALLLVVQGLHLLQPDAGQATAVAAGALVASWGQPSSGAARACAVACALAAAGTWVRFDPLSTASFVEDIVPRAFAVNRSVGCLGVVALAAAALAPIASARHAATGPVANCATRALVAYFATAALVTTLGPFPVPMLGFGASSISGAFLGLAALVRSRQPGAGGRAKPVTLDRRRNMLTTPSDLEISVDRRWGPR